MFMPALFPKLFKLFKLENNPEAGCKFTPDPVPDSRPELAPELKTKFWFVFIPVFNTFELCAEFELRVNPAFWPILFKLLKLEISPEAGLKFTPAFVPEFIGDRGIYPALIPKLASELNLLLEMNPWLKTPSPTKLLEFAYPKLFTVAKSLSISNWGLKPGMIKPAGRLDNFVFLKIMSLNVVDYI